MTTAEHWVGVDEVCMHLAVNKDTIYRWVDTKNFPAHKVGRLFRFKISEVDDWVRADGKIQRDKKSPPIKKKRSAS